MCKVEDKTIEQVRREGVTLESSLAGIDAPLQSERWRGKVHPLAEMEQRIDTLLKLERLVGSFTMEDSPEVVSQRLNEFYENSAAALGPLAAEFGRCRTSGNVIDQLKTGERSTNLKHHEIYFETNVRFARHLYLTIGEIAKKNREVHEIVSTDDSLSEYVQAAMRSNGFLTGELREVSVTPICINLIISEDGFNRVRPSSAGFTYQDEPLTFNKEREGVKSTIYHETVHQFMKYLYVGISDGGIDHLAHDYSRLIRIARGDEKELEELREIYAEYFVFEPEPDEFDDDIIKEELKALVTELSCYSISGLLESLKEEMVAHLHKVRDLQFGDLEEGRLSCFGYLDVYSTASVQFCNLHNILDRIENDRDGIAQISDELHKRLTGVGKSISSRFQAAFSGMRSAFYVAEHISPSLTEELRMATILMPVDDYKRLPTYVRVKAEDRELADALFRVEKIRESRDLSLDNLETIVSVGDILNDEAKAILRKVVAQPLKNYGAFLMDMLLGGKRGTATIDPIEAFELKTEEEVDRYEELQGQLAELLGGTVEELFDRSHIIGRVRDFDEG